MSDTSTTFDYKVPFDIMVGTWAGHSVSYFNDGRYDTTVPSICWIHWIEKGKRLRYFQQDQANLDQLILAHETQDPQDSSDDHNTLPAGSIMTRAFDLVVDLDSPKRVISDDPTAQAARCKVEGLQSRPGNYIFHLDILPHDGIDGGKPFPGANYYNNQYFTNPNERMIIGPYVLNNGTSAINRVIAQTFSRISYDIPKKYHMLEMWHYEKHNLNYDL